MSVLASREALAKALRPHMRGASTIGGDFVECDCGERFPSGGDGGAAQAAHAIGTLPVVDVSTLADDEALREAVEHDIHVLEANASDPSVEQYAAVALRALAAALTERGESDAAE